MRCNLIFTTIWTISILVINRRFLQVLNLNISIKVNREVSILSINSQRKPSTSTDPNNKFELGASTKSINPSLDKLPYRLFCKITLVLNFLNAHSSTSPHNQPILISLNSIKIINYQLPQIITCSKLINPKTLWSIWNSKIKAFRHSFTLSMKRTNTLLI